MLKERERKKPARIVRPAVLVGYDSATAVLRSTVSDHLVEVQPLYFPLHSEAVLTGLRIVRNTNTAVSTDRISHMFMYVHIIEKQEGQRSLKVLTVRKPLPE